MIWHSNSLHSFLAIKKPGPKSQTSQIPNLFASTNLRLLPSQVLSLSRIHSTSHSLNGMELKIMIMTTTTTMMMISSSTPPHDVVLYFLHHRPVKREPARNQSTHRPKMSVCVSPINITHRAHHPGSSRACRVDTSSLRFSLFDIYFHSSRLRATWRKIKPSP